MNPTIKMLTGMAGVDFSVSPREETDRFSDAEARRFVDAGIAEPTEETRDAWAKADAAGGAAFMATSAPAKEPAATVAPARPKAAKPAAKRS